jgi:3-dehydroshikimate dehydratase
VKEDPAVKAGLATIALRDFDIFEIIDLASEAGFEAIEVWGRAPHTPDVYDEQYWATLRDNILARGMEPAVFGSYVNSAGADFQDKALMALKITQALGAPIIRVWAGDKEPSAAVEDDWAGNSANLKWMAERAADKGITLAMEMHCGTLAFTPEGVLRLIELARADNLKLNYQVADPGEPDIERTVRLVGEHSVMVHAQNFIHAAEGSKHPWERSLVEDGTADYRRLLNLLRPYGFDGPVEVEFLKGDPDRELMMEAMRADAEFLNKIIREVS